MNGSKSLTVEIARSKIQHNYHFHFDNLTFGQSAIWYRFNDSIQQTKIIERQTANKKKKIIASDCVQKWYFMNMNYRVVFYMIFGVFRIFVRYTQIKMIICVCVCARACLLYHLFRKMAIYTEFEHLLVVVTVIVMKFDFFVLFFFSFPFFLL